MRKKVTILDRYLEELQKYQNLYGPRTTVLYECGMFFEFYGVENETEHLGMVSEIADMLSIQTTRRKKENPVCSHENHLMAGFPVSSLERFLDVLVKEGGYNVVIIRQQGVEPNITRYVQEIVSPGTYQDPRSSDNNFLVSIFFQRETSKLLSAGLIAYDVNTNECYFSEVHGSLDNPHHTLAEIARFRLTYRGLEHLITTRGMTPTDLHQLAQDLELDLQVTQIHPMNPSYGQPRYQNEMLGRIYPDHGMLSPVEFLGLERSPNSVIALMVLLQYCHEHNPALLTRIQQPILISRDLILENNAIEQLNLISTDRRRHSSVYNIINHTQTPMGSRLLKHRLLSPICDVQTLNRRYDQIQTLLDGSLITSYLSGIRDLEKMHHRIESAKLPPTELVTLDQSYERVQKLINHLLNACPTLAPSERLIRNFMEYRDWYRQRINLELATKYLMDDISENIMVNESVESVLNDESIQHWLNQKALAHCFFEQLSVQLSELIEPGSHYVDYNLPNKGIAFLSMTKKRYQTMMSRAKTHQIHQIHVILNVDAREVRDCQNFGAREETVSLDDFEVIHKKSQTQLLSRIITRYAQQLDEATREIQTKMRQWYLEFLQEMTKFHELWKNICYYLSDLDVTNSHAYCAREYVYSRPIIVETSNASAPEGFSKSLRDASAPEGFSNDSYMSCEGLRHPIIEQIQKDTLYVPQDLCLGREHDGVLLFGVNACGKSSCMKSLGTAIIMAQAGMYVPAKRFEYAPFRHILTRILGNDNLFKGMSSFAVEMTELRDILNVADSQSLILGDEICHGTETFSAISIVGASIVSLLKSRAKFIFATHLHQLTSLEELENPRLRLMHLKMHYDSASDLLIYDRILEEGPGDPIYGLEVARAMKLDPQTLTIAETIRRRILGIPHELVSSKTSRYSSQVSMGICELCGGSSSETHHIKFQKDANEYGIIDHHHKNHPANLVPICERCHQQIHQSQMIIEGRTYTSDGVKLVLDFRDASAPEGFSGEKLIVNKPKLILRKRT